ncbi:MAG: DMT family transporter, partial [Alphaproteobacteria bacterium]|nr:DMT family transporter [Alphaproteobacteria bacterium]
RGLFQSIVVTLALAILYKGKLLQNMLAIGKTGLVASAFLALCNISFVYSLETTGAANTLIIVATTSMWAALISIVMLGERASRPTVLAMVVSFGGILIVFIDDLQAGSLFDNIYGLVTAISMAAALTLIRKKSHVNMVPTAALSAAMAAVVSFPFIGTVDYQSFQWASLLILGLIVLPVSFGCMTIGPRYIPSAEVSLLLLLETTLGPLWVWLGTGEAPSNNEYVGGGNCYCCACCTFLTQT